MAYKVLEVGKRYLKNFGPLAVDEQDGLTKSDLEDAQREADALVNISLGDIYDTSGWAADAPPIIESIADRLGSAQMLEYKYNRDGHGDSDFIRFLLEEAYQLMDLLRRGAPLVKSDGTIQEPKTSLTPRVKERQDKPFGNQ